MSLVCNLRNPWTSTTGPSFNGDLTPAIDRCVTPTFCGVCRRRDSNDVDGGFEDDLVIIKPAGTFPLSSGTTKCLKMSCEGIVHQYGVDAGQLKLFAEVRPSYLTVRHVTYLHLQSPTILRVLVHLEAHLLEIEKLLQKNSLHGVLESPEFKVVSLTDLVLTTAQLTKQKTTTNPASVPSRSGRRVALQPQIAMMTWKHERRLPCVQ